MLSATWRVTNHRPQAIYRGSGMASQVIHRHVRRGRSSASRVGLIGRHGSGWVLGVDFVVRTLSLQGSPILLDWLMSDVLSLDSESPRWARGGRPKYRDEVWWRDMGKG